MRAIEYLEQQGLVELDVAEVRHQFSITRRPDDMERLTAVMTDRFRRREEQEVRRVANVLELVLQDGCQSLRRIPRVIVFASLESMTSERLPSSSRIFFVLRTSTWRMRSSGRCLYTK
jgi:hypothetical protein